MLDLIFVVDNPLQWHSDNLKMNWRHYSAARYFGASSIEYLQRCNAAVYYNPMVKVDNQVAYLLKFMLISHVSAQLLKYGVIAVDDLLEDLTTWKWLYISGRLHKPVILSKG